MRPGVCDFHQEVERRRQKEEEEALRREHAQKLRTLKENATAATVRELDTNVEEARRLKARSASSFRGVLATGIPCICMIRFACACFGSFVCFGARFSLFFSP